MLSTLLLTALLQHTTPALTTQGSAHMRDALAPVQTRPVRARRPALVAAEVGYNGLSGAGLLVGYHFLPKLALDVGGGASMQFARLGGRLRYNWFDSNWTPFVAVGATYGFGAGRTLHFKDKEHSFDYRIGKSPMAQGVLGVAYTGARGFSMMISAGYTQLLKHHNVAIVDGNPTARQRAWVKNLAGSGPTLAVAMGYAF